MNKGLEICKNLESLIPELVYSQETHIVWRDCDQKHRDANPSIGDKDFHRDMVKTYQVRIDVIMSAIMYIGGSQSFSELLKECKPLTKEFKNSIEDLVKNVDVDLDKPLEGEDDE